jgi:adenylylsulfate reductase, subunit A
MHTQNALDTREKEELGWEDFLDMTIGQPVVWASQNIDPKEKSSELITTSARTACTSSSRRGNHSTAS